ncbi:MAG: ChbG/HpnK family deacetylase [Burkholderiales bacterium]|nr:ChbG/HpnK family deacetylase [Burkholderiales bacterium]MBK8667231.1 ChbG/HpnK family deacetylase [Burkholderiales bacterium]
MNTPVKPLVLCADDYAERAGITRAVLDLARRGRLGATSAMVLSPRWREDAAPLREWRGRIDVGLHLDWTSRFAVGAGHGLQLGAAMRRAWLRGFDQADARVVIERQLDAFEAAWQAPPDHVDGHQHVQQFAGIRQALVEVLARRYGARAPWLRISRAPADQRDVKSRVIAGMGAAALERAARAAGLPCAPGLSGIYDFSGDAAGYVARMARWLSTSPAGTVLMCHPALDDAQPADDDPIAVARAWEYAHLASPAFAEQCASAGVQLKRGSALYTARA